MRDKKADKSSAALDTSGYFSDISGKFAEKLLKKLVSELIKYNAKNKINANNVNRFIKVFKIIVPYYSFVPHFISA